MNTKNRRSFLKKAAYVTPVILAMGSLSAHAQSGDSSISKNTVQVVDQNIIVTDPKGGTVVITPKVGGKLSGFQNFLTPKV